MMSQHFLKLFKALKNDISMENSYFLSGSDSVSTTAVATDYLKK
jgi:hypothetical protein